AIEEIGGGPEEGQTIKAVLIGASNAVLGPQQLDTPLTYEDMQAAGSGLGSGSYLVYDQRDDMAAVAAGVARFLAVESCGQCTPCKQDGLEISDRLARVVNVRGSVDDLELVRKNVDSVAFGARCSLATQHQLVIASFLAAFGPDFEARVERGRPRGEPLPIVPMADLRGGVATLDDDFARKQPDWT